MVGFLKTLKNLHHLALTPRSGADEITLSPLSPSWSETTVHRGSFSSTVVDEFEADLYQSLFNAFAENNNLPLNDTDIPSLTTDSITSGNLTLPVASVCEESHSGSSRDQFAKNVTFKDYDLLIKKRSRKPPVDQAPSSISVQDGSANSQSSVSSARRGIFLGLREKSHRIVDAVKTAFRPRGDVQHRNEITNPVLVEPPVEVVAQSRVPSDTSFSSVYSRCSGSIETVCHWRIKNLKFPTTQCSRHDCDKTAQNPQHSDCDASVFESSEYAPPAVSCLPEYDLPRRSLSDLGLHGFHKIAFMAFNKFAMEHGLYTLCPPEYDPINFQIFLRVQPSRRELILRKVRSIGSSFRPRSPNRRINNLRRMRTFANISLKYYKMDSLKGTDLATMGRLCGYDSLTLPTDFAPVIMKLPTPIVSLVSYLLIHGPYARNIFHEPGDVIVASRIYNHFAAQILDPEEDPKGKYSTKKTMNFSIAIFGKQLDSKDFLRGRFHVLSVAWAFKYMLACIPGGILGAPRLYGTLVDIVHHTFPDEATSPQRDLKKALAEISPTKARAISLAILALTNNLQLDFLCAIFGLCSFLDHETRATLDYYESKNIPRVNRECLLDRERLLLTFTPLLCEETKEINDEDYGCEATKVMAMILDYWPIVSRHLRDAIF